MEGIAALFVADHATTTVERDDLTFGLYLNRKPGARVLLVSLANCHRRGVSPLPSVVPLDWDNSCHVLSICDPTLFLNDKIQIGAFLGDHTRDPIPTVVEIAFETALLLGVSPDRVVFWGLSGGGFAAMRAACLSGGTAVAINAQTEIEAVADWNVFHWMAEAFGAGGCVRTMCDLAPNRMSISAAYRDACAAGRSPTLILAQNEQDDRHFNDHYTPFLAALPGVMGLTYSSPEAHAPASPEINRWILAEALAHLSQDRAQVA